MHARSKTLLFSYNMHLFLPYFRGGRYTGMNVTTGTMLCHDMDFAIPWILLHIHGFHWMDRQIFFPPLHQRERDRDALLDRT